MQPVTSINHDGEFNCNSNEIADTLAVRYVDVSSIETYPLDFLVGKAEVGRDLDIEICATGDTAAVPDYIPYSIIRHLPDVAMATLLALYNVIWMQEDYSKRWKEVIVTHF